MSRYDQMVEQVFLSKYMPQSTTLEFTREELIATAVKLGIVLPANVGDVVYSYRYRKDLPKALIETQAGRYGMGDKTSRAR